MTKVAKVPKVLSGYFNFRRLRHFTPQFSHLTTQLTGFFVFIFLASTLSIAGENKTIADLPRYGGTLVIGISGDIDSFNPLFNEAAMSQEITHLLLLGLADLNERAEFTPELAESWHRSDDFLELTYFLRKDAAWSDGKPITAEDVEFTFKLLMDSTVASPRQNTAEYIKRVVVKDPHTVTFEFSHAYPDQMFDTAGEILPKHIFANADKAALRTHEFGRKPISSGPFVVKKWISQQYIELIPNPKYFGARAFLNSVIFKIVSDQANMLLQLQTGEIDMMIGVPPAEVDQLRQSNPNLTIYPIAGRIYYYVGYNNANPLFSDAKVRQALTLAMDRQQIIDALLFGFGSHCTGPIPAMIQWVPTKSNDNFSYDPQKARVLLASAGWRDSNGDGWLDKDGRKFEFELKTNADNQLRSDVAVIIQDQLRRAGISVKISTMEWGAMADELRAGKFDACMGGWSTSFNVDLTPLFHSSATDLFNFVNYKNTEVDRLIETGREEMNRAKAAAAWGKAQELIYADQPYTFLFWIDKIVAVNKKFRNVTPIPLSALYNLEKWHLSETR